MIIGSTILTIPITFTEEAWRLSETLSIINLVGMFFMSIAFLAMYTYHGIFQGGIKNRKGTYLWWIFVDYLVTHTVVCLILLVLNKLCILNEASIAFSRMNIMLLLLGAVLIDCFDKE
ncbi:MAG: putative membrane protein [Cyclobacteriaceae bacterium]|jgi:uncharacterized membrane protein